MSTERSEPYSRTDEAVTPPSTRSTFRVRALGVAAGVVALAGLVTLGVLGYQNAQRVRAEAQAFLAALRAGDVDHAYAHLSARRRAALTREAFAALIDHPAFRAHDVATDGRLETRSGGTCFHGNLELHGAEWVIELFVVDEGGTYRVESFAIQPPAEVQLGMLLEECGFSEGTLLGYSGPAIERSTTPLE